jgi:outer membrane protein assembly factor BamB
LTAVTHSPALVSGQSPGFFTTVSSNGQTNAIIWAVSHPASVTSNGIFLYAFDPSVSGTMKQLFQGTAGSWPNFKANANLVPVVANGRVYVASNKQLQIFGLK